MSKCPDCEVLRKELAEAKAALDVYDRTFPKKSELELHAALEAANARVATIQTERDDAIARVKRAEFEGKNLNHNLREANTSLAEAKAQLNEAEEARCDAETRLLASLTELEAANARIEQLEHSCAVLNHVYKETEARAERAEARIAELEKRPSEEDVARLMWQQQTTVAAFIAAAEARAERAEAQLLAERSTAAYKDVQIQRAEARVALDVPAKLSNAISRAERAEARVAEFADKGTLQALRDANDRAERAEAECKALREALCSIEQMVDHSNLTLPERETIRTMIRAALKSSPC